MDFHINIKKKSFVNPHDKTSIDVLKNINIKIKYKEFVCIVGPSGCGKTTLMNIIGGLIDAEDQKLNKEQNDLKADGDFGYCFRRRCLYSAVVVGVIYDPAFWRESS